MPVVQRESLHVYEFGNYRLNPVKRVLTHVNGEVVALKPKVFDILRYLVEHPAQLVEKKTLLDAVWPNVIVEDHNLNKNISILRRALGEGPNKHEYIATIPGRGYQLTCDVRSCGVGETFDRASYGASSSEDGEARSSSATVHEDSLRRLASQHLANERTGGRWWLIIAAVAVIIAAGVAGTLARNAAPSPTAARSSVAVLPFININAPQEQYLGDGLTEELIVRLGRIPNLIVSPLTASFYFKDKTALPETIARTLGVRYLIEGTVRLSGDYVRLAVRLVDTQRATESWQRTFEGTRADMLRLQDRVSLAVGERLQLDLLRDVRSRLTLRTTNSVEAQEVYFRARSIGRGGELDDLNRAIRYYERATEFDPKYVGAYIGWADTLLRVSQFAESSPSSAGLLARGLLEQALQIDPRSASAHAVLASISHQAVDCDGAREELTAAEKVDPNDVEVMIHFSRHYFLCDWDPARALHYAQRAADRDPWAALHVTLAHWHRFDYDAALHEVDRLAARFPDYWIAQWSRWWILDDLERFDEALHVAQRVIALNDYAETQTCLAIAHARVGDVPTAWQIYNELASRQQYWSPSFEALLLVALGEHDKALSKLEEAYSRRDGALLAVLHIKAFRPLHGDKRFAALVDRLDHEKHVKALIRALEAA